MPKIMTVGEKGLGRIVRRKKKGKRAYCYDTGTKKFVSCKRVRSKSKARKTLNQKRCGAPRCAVAGYAKRRKSGRLIPNEWIPCGRGTINPKCLPAVSKRSPLNRRWNARVRAHNNTVVAGLGRTCRSKRSGRFIRCR